MLYALSNFRQLRTTKLYFERATLAYGTRSFADKRSDTRSFNEPLDTRSASTTNLSHDDLRKIEDAVGLALRRRRAAAEPYVKAHRTYRASAPYKKLVRAFELAEAQKKSKFVRTELWDAYTNARYRLGSELPSLLTEKAWILLWNSQDSIPSNPELRAKRLKLLAADREKAGFTTTLQERIAKIEALFNDGYPGDALQQWSEEHNNPMRSGDGFRPEHLSLGIRMYQRTGDWERAKALLAELYMSNPEFDTQVMDAFVSGYADTLKSQKDFWDLYKWITSVLNDHISLAQRENMFAIFVSRGCPVHAMTVLEDMVRHKQLSVEWTREAASATLNRMRLLYTACTDTSQVNEVSLLALSFLPFEYSMVLFKRWLREIGKRGQAEASAQILELMYERGLTPRTYHLNLLLMCLWQSNNAKMCSQAETIAIQMIGARHETSKRRSHKRVETGESYDDIESTHGTNQTTNLNAENGNRKPTSIVDRAKKKKLEPFFKQRQISPADPKTCAQLLQYYVKVNRLDDAQYLMEHLDEIEREAKDRKDFLIESSLFDAKIYYYLNLGKHEEVWHDIMGMGPRPNLARYNAAVYYRLWIDLRNTRLREEYTSRPDPRAFLAHMVEWQQNVRPIEKARISKRFTKLSTRFVDIQYLIATCFRQTYDLPGTLVAMHVLHNHFGLAPSPRMIKTLFNQLVALALPTDTPEERRENSRRGGRWGYTMVRMLNMYHKLLQKRFQSETFIPDTYKVDLDFTPKLQSGGSSVTVFRQPQFTLDALSELIIFVMVRMNPRTEVERMIAEARDEIGVPQMSTGSVDALHVS